jgi:hypothetical protein
MMKPVDAHHFIPHELIRLKGYEVSELDAALRHHCSAIPEDVRHRLEDVIAASDPLCAAALARLQPQQRCLAILLSLVVAEAAFELSIRSEPSREPKFRATCDRLGLDYALIVHLTGSESSLLAVLAAASELRAR